MLVNMCSCESCVENHWARRAVSIPCPFCYMPLSRANFHLQLCDLPAVEKEVSIRRKLAKEYSHSLRISYCIAFFDFTHFQYSLILLFYSSFQCSFTHYVTLFCNLQQSKDPSWERASLERDILLPINYGKFFRDFFILI